MKGAGGRERQGRTFACGVKQHTSSLYSHTNQAAAQSIPVCAHVQRLQQSPETVQPPGHPQSTTACSHVCMLQHQGLQLLLPPELSPSCARMASNTLELDPAAHPPATAAAAVAACSSM